MTIPRIGGIAVLVALLLAGCSAPAGGPSVAPDPSPGGDTLPTAVPASNPGPEICAVQSAFDEADALLEVANVENPPAPTYGSALAVIESVVPPESIAGEWNAWHDGIADYWAVLQTGDSEAIREQADEVVAITDLQFRLYGYFMAFCS